MGLTGEWTEALEALVRFLDKYDKERRFSFKGGLALEFERLREEFRDSFVEWVVGNEIGEAYSWVKVLTGQVKRVKQALMVEGVTFPKELSSFLKDPREHLKKKIFLYTLDLLRGRIKLAEFVRTSSAAIKTSLRTNMRSVYQSWVFLSLLEHLAKNGARLIYPEYGYLSLERTGKQKLGAIPPNSVLSIEGVGYVSFFIEAPRPVGWEDSKDLKRVWKLYVALRPDMLVYAGKVLDIVRPFRDPPIERPNLIIECKELVDWYQRVRDLKGTLAKPLSAEEWRSRWIQGLYDGLADVLGVKRQEAINLVKERKTVRVKEDRLVALYRSLYKPDVMVLVSRAKVPCDVRRNLEEHGIEVLDDVGFNKDSLKPLADVVIDVVSKQPRKELDVYVEAKLLLEEVLKRGESLEVEDLDRVLALAVRFARAKLDDFVGFLARRDGRE